VSIWINLEEMNYKFQTLIHEFIQMLKNVNQKQKDFNLKSLKWKLIVVNYLLYFSFIVIAQDTTPKDIYPSQIRLLATGDVNLGHWITPIIKSEGNHYPFTYVKDRLSQADFVFANLEAPFCTKGQPFPKNFVFDVPPVLVDVLTAGNINLVSLANNHTMDYGMPGLLSTIETLNKANIRHAGAGKDKGQAYKPALLEKYGIKIAFFSYTMTHPEEFWANDSKGGTAYPYANIVKDSLRYYDDKTDFIIVSFHWGKELQSIPEQYQSKMAHFVINAGADLVLGHHPHILQGIEKYKDRYIFYSFGNFIFASYSHKASESIIADIILSKDGLNKIEIIPINVDNYEVHFKPEILNGAEKVKVLAHLNTISLDLNNQQLIINESGNLN